MNRIVTKTILLGDKCKSDYRRSFFGNGFYYDHVDMLGAQHSSKQIEVNNISLEHQIWEISEKNKFKLVRKHFLQGTASIIIILNELNQSKLESLRFWFEEMSLVVDTDINFVVIINKDRCNHLQCKDILNDFCTEIHSDYGLIFSSINCFCSSLDTGKNIEATFEFLSTEVLKSIKNN